MPLAQHRNFMQVGTVTMKTQDFNVTISMVTEPGSKMTVPQLVFPLLILLQIVMDCHGSTLMLE